MDVVRRVDVTEEDRQEVLKALSDIVTLCDRLEKVVLAGRANDFIVDIGSRARSASRTLRHSTSWRVDLAGVS